jgi:hypothetical protein
MSDDSDFYNALTGAGASSSSSAVGGGDGASASRKPLVDDSFKFSCPYCCQHIRAYPEHAGDEIECPGCEENFIVPRQSYVCKNEPELNPARPRLFDHEELELLIEEDVSVRSLLAGATTHNCWEFNLVAALLLDRLEPLRMALEQYNDYEAEGARWRSSSSQNAQFIDDSFREYSKILDATQCLLTDDLDNAMYDNELFTCIDFVNKLGQEIMNMRELYQGIAERPINQDTPFPELLHHLKLACYHFWQAVGELAAHLEYAAASAGRKPEFQLSFVPPGIHSYYKLRAQLK